MPNGKKRHKSNDYKSSDFYKKRKSTKIENCHRIENKEIDLQYVSKGDSKTVIPPSSNYYNSNGNINNQIVKYTPQDSICHKMLAHIKSSNEILMFLEDSLLSKDTLIMQYENQIATLKSQLECSQRDNNQSFNSEASHMSLNSSSLSSSSSSKEKIFMKHSNDLQKSNTESSVIKNMNKFLKLTAGMSLISKKDIDIPSFANVSQSAYAEKSFEEFCVQIKNFSKKSSKEIVFLLRYCEELNEMEYVPLKDHGIRDSLPENHPIFGLSYVSEKQAPQLLQLLLKIVHA